MTLFFITLLGLMLVLATLYWFPLPGKPFHQLYANVTDGQRTALQAFRLENQLKQMHVNGSKWDYLVAGEGDQTIVFLHGMGGGFDIWFQQINHFKASYRIISMTYPPVSSLGKLSEGVMAILDREKRGRVYMVGSSLGGYLVQYLVKNHADRIEKAVFANTFPPNRLLAKKVGKVKYIVPLLPEWMVMRNLRQTTQAAIFPASGHSELVRAYMLEQSYGMMKKAQFVGRLMCVLDYFEPPDLDALSIPCLIIEADNDPLVETGLRKMLKTTYPSTPVQTLSQKGHFPYLNAPQDYNRILKQFIGNR
jgi:pimeloyl-ACP methyl ester carboxylesterase